MITLWGRNNSTNVKKVRWTLEELDLPYNQILAGLEFGLNHEAEYLAKNPNGLVPLLIDDETQTTLWESNSIVRSTASTACGLTPRRSGPRRKSGWTGPTARSPRCTG